MSRHTVLLATLVTAATITVLVLFDVLATVFFAVTLVFVVAPMHDALVERGVPPRIASGASLIALLALAGGVAVALGLIIYARRALIVGWVEALPEVFELSVAGARLELEVAELGLVLVDHARQLGISLAPEVPAFLLKTGLLVLIVYGLLLGKGTAVDSITRVVSEDYHDVLGALYVRTEETLWGVYVIQLVTAFVTFLLALPLFYLLGYELYVTLALLCGLFQFLPIVGPSLVIATIGIIHLLAGELLPAVLVVGLGFVIVAAAPDLVVRPKLARRTAGLNGTLYFIGFVGGLLSVGFVGIVAGPLAIALLVESVALVSDHRSMIDRGFVGD